jgi:hypothetical protein
MHRPTAMRAARYGISDDAKIVARLPGLDVTPARSAAGTKFADGHDGPGFAITPPVPPSPAF